MMRIVNVRKLKPNDPTIVYCGREGNGWRGSPLGNPFYIGKDGTREEVIKKYKEWLLKKLDEGDKSIWNALTQINFGDQLGCWCYPKECHCEVIMDLWNQIQEMYNRDDRERRSHV